MRGWDGLKGRWGSVALGSGGWRVVLKDGVRSVGKDLTEVGGLRGWRGVVWGASKGGEKLGGGVGVGR